MTAKLFFAAVDDLVDERVTNVSCSCAFLSNP